MTSQDKGECDKSIADFTEAVRLNPQSASAYFDRGRAWYFKQEFDKAIADYSEAIRLDPREAKAYHNRGYTWNSKQEYDKAIADYNEAIRLDPKEAKAYGNRGNAWNSKQEYDKAIADYNKAIRIAPESAHAYVRRGLSWGSKGAYDKAIVDYNRAIRINPQSADAFHNRGIAWVKKERYRKAIADCTRAIQIDPEDARIYNVRGVARKRDGKYREAISDYSEAIRLEPESSSRHETLAWLLATCPDGRYRDGTRAVQLADRACELTNYTNANSLSYLAASHAEEGDFDTAIAWQQKALGLAAADQKSQMKWHLERYEAGKPYHEEHVVITNSLLQVLRIVWALPYTLLGLSIGGIGLCAGGQVRFRGRVIEFYEGGTKWFVTHIPGGPFMAFTLGHTIHGESESALDIAHDHEMVHVRQFERWGPLMGPAYLISSFVLWIVGRRPYRDNPFEREAYGEEGD